MRIRTAVVSVPAVLATVIALMPATASAAIHVVEPGETLTSVAAADGLRISALAAANKISSTAELIAGQVLVIPAQTSSTAASSSWSGTTTAGTRHAAVSTTTTTQTTQTTAATTTTSPTTSTTTTTPSQTTSGSTPVPTDERVSAAEIVHIADSEGVSPGLAEGIAWQESGWNNDVVSSVGAVGVMQIVPSTWSWINTYLTPANPLEPASAAENIRGGVLLLHDLLSLTGGNERMAIAAYYQGLSSVRAHGFYSDTQQYVNNVEALAARFG